jgi:CheY-like chemotaxis protein
MAYRILVIDESKLIRDYLSRKLADLGFEVTLAASGFEGGLKMRGTPPDLIIMDYVLSRVSSVQLLEQKMQDPHFRDTPVIMLATQLTRERLVELAKFRIRKFFAKPLRVDGLLRGISEVLGTTIAIDDTPCILDVHFNDGILVVEVARGINGEKLELLPYKISEILGLYGVRIPKVLLIVTDMGEGEAARLHELIAAVRAATRTPWSGIKLLTTSDDVRKAVADTPEYAELEIAEDLTRAMDGLLGLKVSGFVEEGQAAVKSDLLQADAASVDSELSFRMKLDEPDPTAGGAWADVTIAVVDDDEVIRSLVNTTFSKLGCRVSRYADGGAFLQALADPPPSLVFLDMMMPQTNGLEVLAALKQKKIEVPVVVLSALSKRDTVVKAVAAGVKSYMIKPIKPEQLLQKTIEILKANF